MFISTTQYQLKFKLLKLVITSKTNLFHYWHSGVGCQLEAQLALSARDLSSIYILLPMWLLRFPPRMVYRVQKVPDRCFF